MKQKQAVRIDESKLVKIVKESVKRVLNEMEKINAKTDSGAIRAWDDSEDEKEEPRGPIDRESMGFRSWKTETPKKKSRRKIDGESMGFRSWNA